MSELTHDEGIIAGDVATRAQSLIGITALQFDEEELDLLERSLNELEASIRPRDTLAELFGRSSFDQKDQTIKANLSALRHFIAMCRAVQEAGDNSRLTTFGSEIFGDDQ